MIRSVAVPRGCVKLPMRLLHKFLHLSSAKRRLLLAAGLVVPSVRILLWVLPFRHVVRLAGAKAALKGCATAAPRSEDIAWAVTTASAYVPRATCLTQALAARWLFARLGWPALLRLGVAKGEDKGLKAHAWLESEGRVVVGAEGLQEEEYAALPLPAKFPS